LVLHLPLLPLLVAPALLAAVGLDRRGARPGVLVLPVGPRFPVAHRAERGVRRCAAPAGTRDACFQSFSCLLRLTVGCGLLCVRRQTRLHRSQGRILYSVPAHLSLCPFTRTPPPTRSPFGLTASYTLPGSLSEEATQRAPGGHPAGPRVVSRWPRGAVKDFQHLGDYLLLLCVARCCLLAHHLAAYPFQPDSLSHHSQDSRRFFPEASGTGLPAVKVLCQHGRVLLQAPRPEPARVR
jgi:hypothetical protein